MWKITKQDVREHFLKQLERGDKEVPKKVEEYLADTAVDEHGKIYLPFTRDFSRNPTFYAGMTDGEKKRV